MAAKLYKIFNSAMPTTAAPVKQPTGAAIRTMWQVAPNVPCRVVEWGVSFDGFTAVAPGVWELIDTGAVFATMSTAFVAADIDPWGDPNAPVNSAGSTGVPFGLGASLSGFATAAVTEGATTVARVGDAQLLPPTAPYVLQYPLGREFEVAAGRCLRVRCTTPATVNALIYVTLEV